MKSMNGRKTKPSTNRQLVTNPKTATGTSTALPRADWSRAVELDGANDRAVIVDTASATRTVKTVNANSLTDCNRIAYRAKPIKLDQGVRRQRNFSHAALAARPAKVSAVDNKSRAGFDLQPHA